MQVFSEIGALQKVLLHRPGRELESLTPQYLDSMLFEDIPFLERMQEEHDAFAGTLRQRGCEVLYVEQLLCDLLREPQLRSGLIELTLSGSRIPSLAIREQLQGALGAMDEQELAQHLIGGVRKDELHDELTGSRANLSYFIRDEYPFYISPLPNLYFTRDPGAVIGRVCAINRMHTGARMRETVLLSAIASHHHAFRDTPAEAVNVLEGYTGESSIEGGDILVLNERTVAIGCSARSEAWAIEALADRILSDDGTDGGFRQVLVVQIPFTRAYMHLDTVFTMVDHDKFTIYPGVEPHLRLFTITRSAKGPLRIAPEKGLRTALKRVLHIAAVDLIKTGGGDRITAAREQWNDSTNTLAIAPGVVVTYRRNMVSNDTLAKHGITVLPIRGSELVRGRGGPRCMSMPLYRELI